MTITPEQARAELARRKGSQGVQPSTNTITPEMARAELARRQSSIPTRSRYEVAMGIGDKTQAPATKAPGTQIIKDILGTDTSEPQNFAGSLFQSTLGSKGAAGVGQDLGNALTNRLKLGIIGDTNENAQRISDTGSVFSNLANNETNPERKAKLLAQAQQMSRDSGTIQQQSAQDLSQVKQVNPIGTAGKVINAGATLIGGEGAANAANQTFKGEILQGAKEGAKNFGAFGGAQGLGNSLINGDTPEQTLKNTAVGYLEGAATGAAFGSASPVIGKGISALTPEAESIMNRVARLNPSDAQKFEKLAGESHGKYLERTGNFGTPQQIVENESKKFVNSLNEVDNALAQLPGEFKSPRLKTVLSDLIEREKSIGVPNAETARIAELAKKQRTVGLNMSEINEVKRIYERTVKLGYQKEQNAIGIARSTRLDSALREWQFELANKLGLKNLPELNKQTQLSKFIVDKLGKRLAGASGNNAITLTDWIMLSGGDPTSIGGFLLKKGLLNKGFQSKFAQFISKENPQGLIKAELGDLATQTSRTAKLQPELLLKETGKPYTNTVPKSGLPVNFPKDNPSMGEIAPKTGVLNKLKDQRGFISTGSNDPLISEARKYKSADEFATAFSSPDKYFEILPKSYLKTPTKLYRGEQAMTGLGTGSGAEGFGLYTTTNKKIANSYAKLSENGVLKEMPLSSAPQNPLYFRGPAEVQSYIQRVAKNMGMRVSEFNEKIGINKLVSSMGYDGVAFQHGSDYGTAFVKFPEKDLVNKSQLTDLWNKANKGGKSSVGVLGAGAAVAGTLLAAPLLAGAIQKGYNGIKNNLKEQREAINIAATLGGEGVVGSRNFDKQVKTIRNLLKEKDADRLRSYLEDQKARIVQ